MYTGHGYIRECAYEVYYRVYCISMRWFITMVF